VGTFVVCPLFRYHFGVFYDAVRFSPCLTAGQIDTVYEENGELSDPTSVDSYLCEGFAVAGLLNPLMITLRSSRGR
jgi:hypothetical protein